MIILIILAFFTLAIRSQPLDDFSSSTAGEDSSSSASEEFPLPEPSDSSSLRMEDGEFWNPLYPNPGRYIFIGLVSLILLIFLSKRFYRWHSIQSVQRDRSNTIEKMRKSFSGLTLGKEEYTIQQRKARREEILRQEEKDDERNRIAEEEIFYVPGKKSFHKGKGKFSWKQERKSKRETIKKESFELTFNPASGMAVATPLAGSGRSGRAKGSVSLTIRESILQNSRRNSLVPPPPPTQGYAINLENALDEWRQAIGITIENNQEEEEKEKTEEKQEEKEEEKEKETEEEKEEIP